MADDFANRAQASISVRSGTSLQNSVATFVQPLMPLLAIPVGVSDQIFKIDVHVSRIRYSRIPVQKLGKHRETWDSWSPSFEESMYARNILVRQLQFLSEFTQFPRVFWIAVGLLGRLDKVEAQRGDSGTARHFRQDGLGTIGCD